MEGFLCRGVEKDDRDRGEEEDRHINEEAGNGAKLWAEFVLRENEEAEGDQEEISVIGGEVGGGLKFNFEGLFRAPDVAEALFAALDRSFGPAVLLIFESSHVDGEFGWCFDLAEEEEFPSIELRTVGKVHVFGQGVVFPAAGVNDR